MELDTAISPIPAGMETTCDQTRLRKVFQLLNGDTLTCANPDNFHRLGTVGTPPHPLPLTQGCRVAGAGSSFWEDLRPPSTSPPCGVPGHRCAGCDPLALCWAGLATCQGDRGTRVSVPDR